MHLLLLMLLLTAAAFFFLPARVKTAFVVVMAMWAAASPALADASTSVHVPIGSWVGAAVDLLNQIALPLVALIVAWVSRFLPTALANYLAMLRVDQLLEKAIGYALTAVQGAVAGKELTVDVGNKVLATALTYAVENAPTLVAWAGGPDALRKKILARLTVSADATVTTDANGAAVLQ